jgi:glycosyltransferase involved in cell wall biosynthesis
MRAEKSDPSGMRESVSPLVSVIIPAYNTAGYIGEALDSVFAQTFTNYEVIVVNDGSPDTPALERALLPYRERVVYIAQENRGPSAARNAGIRAAHGRLIALLDSDDIWEPEYLAVHVAAMEADPTIDVIYPNALIFGDSDLAGREFMEQCPSEGEVTFERLLTYECNVMVSVTARRETIVGAGMFDESESLAGTEDFELWLRIAQRGGRIVYHRRVLVRYRRRAGSLSADMTRIFSHGLQVMDKAERSLSLTPGELATLRRTRTRLRALYRFHQGKTAFLGGDTRVAIEALREANAALGSIRIGVLLVLLRLAPRLLLGIYHLRARLRLRPAAKR